VGVRHRAGPETFWLKHHICLLIQDFDMCDELSRMKSLSHGRFGRENDRWGFTQASAIRVTGRHMINIWRAMRGELNLTQYTLENVTFHLLHRRRRVPHLDVPNNRVPHYSHSDLTRWYQGRDQLRVFLYYTSRCVIDLEILDAQDLIAKVWSGQSSAYLILAANKPGSLESTFTPFSVGDPNSKSNR